MKKILGIPVALFIAAILVIGSGTALLVKYLSNTVTHTVNVASPLEVLGDSNLNLNLFGGEIISYTTTTINHANISIDAYPITEISGPAIFTGDEFTDIELENVSGVMNMTTHTYVVKDDGTLIPLAGVGTLNKTTIKVFFDDLGTGLLHTHTFDVGYNQWTTTVFSTHVAIVPGTYTIKTCNLYDYSGDC